MKIFQRADYTATFPLCTTLLPWYCQSLILVLPTSVLIQVVRLCHLPLPSSSISRQAISGIASVSRPKHSRIILPGDRYIATENELDMVGRFLLHHSSPGWYPHAPTCGNMTFEILSPLHVTASLAKSPALLPPCPKSRQLQLPAHCDHGFPLGHCSLLLPTVFGISTVI